MLTQIAAAGGLVAACSAALAVHRRLSGARLGADQWDELQVRWSSLDALASGFLANPDRSDLVVSLTTIPGRIDRLAPTLKSLLRQTRRPDEIRINVPEFSRREQRAYTIPGWLADLGGIGGAISGVIRLVRCEDYGPATKLIPSLLDLGPAQRILVVDDDRIYGPRLVEDLDVLARARPDAVLAAGGWRVPDDLTDRPTTLLAQLRRAPYVPVLGSLVSAPVEVDIVQGVHGYVVQPRFFDLARVVDFSTAPPEAVFCDDVWISAHARARKYVVPVRRISVSPIAGAGHYKRTSLATNFNSRRSVDRRANTVMIRHFAGAWRRS